MTNITVIYGHPEPGKSLANRAVLERFSQLAPSAGIVTLAELYPNGVLDIKKEQDRLVASDTIIFQFPVWWYAIPWLLSKYISEVFAYDFAYGNRFALDGKKFVLSFTCGGGEKSYTKDGLYHLTIAEIMSPMYGTARYCRLHYLGDVITYHMMPEDCPKDRIVKKAHNQGEELAKLVLK